jgi:copper transporter 1
VQRASSRAKAAREQRRSVNSENTTLLSANGNNDRQPLLAEIIKGTTDVSIFAFHNVLSYGLMLAVMLYNGYIFLAVVLGSFVGHFLFGHLSMKINMENLQAIHTKMVCSSRCAESGEAMTLWHSTLSCLLSSVCIS